MKKSVRRNSYREHPWEPVRNMYERDTPNLPTKIIPTNIA